MTYSLIVRDPETGALGGAVATGTPAVGGFVLHLAPGVGAIATQGYSTNTLYGSDGLRLLAGGASAAAVVERVTARDAGRDFRQLIVLDDSGASSGWTGPANVDAKAHRCETDLAVAGNWIESTELLDALGETYLASRGALAERLLRALAVSRRAGSDKRGLQSAALRVVALDRPPLDLRVDFDPDPLSRLAEVYRATRTAEFQAFLQRLPTPADPGRH